MRLDEIAQQPALDKAAILAELKKLGIKARSTINDDGSVDVVGNVKIPPEYTKIPVQFRTVTGTFNCGFTQITSLQGSPQHVGGGYYCHSSQITSLQYIPRYVAEDVYCSVTNITSLHNIHKTHADWVIGGKLWLPASCTHLLGLAYISGVKRIHLGGGNVVGILHDVFEWQEKLLEMGLTEQAQL